MKLLWAASAGLALAPALLAAGCQSKPPPDPVARFQMISAGNARHDVIVLDSQSGDIWACGPNLDLPLSVVCGVPQGRPQ